MEHIFILPKAAELNEPEFLEIKNRLKNEAISTENVTILNPAGLIIKNEGIVDKQQSAIKISEKINEINKDGKECYLLYHIGNLFSVDGELKTILPNLHSQMYSSADGEEHYKQAKSAIAKIFKGELDSNKFISDFFFDKKLEASLELLHKCLTQKSVPENLNDFPLLKDYQSDFQKFNKSQKEKGAFDEEYMNALAALRDKLLQDY